MHLLQLPRLLLQLPRQLHVLAPRLRQLRRVLPLPLPAHERLPLQLAPRLLRRHQRGRARALALLRRKAPRLLELQRVGRVVQQPLRLLDLLPLSLERRRHRRVVRAQLVSVRLWGEGG